MSVVGMVVMVMLVVVVRDRGLVRVRIGVFWEGERGERGCQLGRYVFPGCRAGRLLVLCRARAGEDLLYITSYIKERFLNTSRDVY